MTPQEALAQEMRVEDTICLHNGEEDASDCPRAREGWALRHISATFAAANVADMWREQGAQQERERLRAAAVQDFSDGNIPLVVAAVIDRLLADPEDDPQP